MPGHLIECAYKRILTKHLVKGSVGRTHRRLQRALDRQRYKLTNYGKLETTPTERLHQDLSMQCPAARSMCVGVEIDTRYKMLNKPSHIVGASKDRHGQLYQSEYGSFLGRRRGK